MNTKPMMKCGHAANSTTAAGDPACVVCVGLAEGALDVDDDPPDLSGRKATCFQCGERERPSSPGLAFFEHRPADSQDLYYCGCRGWD